MREKVLQTIYSIRRSAFRKLLFTKKFGVGFYELRPRHHQRRLTRKAPRIKPRERRPVCVPLVAPPEALRTLPDEARTECP